MAMAELRQQLSAIEPDESTYAGIGPSEVPQLRQLLTDQKAWLAARAVYALSRIDTAEARAALLTAAGSPRSEVRVAVAANATKLVADVSNTILQVLLDDPNAGVRKFAIESVSDRNDATTRLKLIGIASTDNDPAIRAMARDRRDLLPPP
jgi:HEAT repeat protein